MCGQFFKDMIVDPVRETHCTYSRNRRGSARVIWMTQFDLKRDRLFSLSTFSKLLCALHGRTSERASEAAGWRAGPKRIKIPSSWVSPSAADGIRSMKLQQRCCGARARRWPKLVCQLASAGAAGRRADGGGAEERSRGENVNHQRCRRRCQWTGRPALPLPQSHSTPLH